MIPNMSALYSAINQEINELYAFRSGAVQK